MKKLIALLLAVLMIVSLVACGAKEAPVEEAPVEEAPVEETPVEEEAPVEETDSDLAYVTENGKMLVGITIYEPMNYYDEAGELTGFDTEFAQAVCEKMVWLLNSSRSTGTPRKWNWPPRALTASGTA